MSAKQLVEQLRADGFSIRSDSGQVLVSPADRVTPGVVELVRSNKAELLKYLQSKIPCQVQWQPDCGGPSAPTTLISPTRYGFKASPDQCAAACESCRKIMQERSKNQNIYRENYLLWGVFRTQQYQSPERP